MTKRTTRILLLWMTIFTCLQVVQPQSRQKRGIWSSLFGESPTEAPTDTRIPPTTDDPGHSLHNTTNSDDDADNEITITSKTETTPESSTSMAANPLKIAEEIISSSTAKTRAITQITKTATTTTKETTTTTPKATTTVKPTQEPINNDTTSFSSKSTSLIPTPVTEVMIPETPITESTTETLSKPTKPSVNASDYGKQLAEILIRSNQDKMYQINGDVEYEMYLVAFTTLQKVDSIMQEVKHQISRLLGKECRDYMPWFKSQPLAQFENREHVALNHDSGSHSADYKEFCLSTRDFVDKQLIQLESLILDNQKFRGKSFAYREETKKFHKRYSMAVKNTLSNYRISSTDTDLLKSLISSTDVLNPFDTVKPEKSSVIISEIESKPVAKTASLNETIIKINATINKDNKNVEDYRQNSSEITTSTSATITVASHTTPNIPNTKKTSLSDNLVLIQQISNSLQKSALYEHIINEYMNSSLNYNSLPREIFRIASSIDNSGMNTPTKSKLITLFPHIVQSFIWLDGVKIQVQIGTTFYKIIADGGNQVKTVRIEDSNSKGGDTWRFVPLKDGDSYVIFNVEVNSALTVIVPASEPEYHKHRRIQLEKVAHQDISTLPSRFGWKPSLVCDAKLARDIRMSMAKNGTRFNTFGNQKITVSDNECPQEAWLITFDNQWQKDVGLEVDSAGTVYPGEAGHSARFQLFQ